MYKERSRHTICVLYFCPWNFRLVLIRLIVVMVQFLRIYASWTLEPDYISENAISLVAVVLDSPLLQFPYLYNVKKNDITPISDNCIRKQ